MPKLFSLLLLRKGKFSKNNKIYNWLESKVPKYTLPNHLIFQDGSLVFNKEDWSKKQRNEILNLFKKYVYGRNPEKPKTVTFELEFEDNHALNNKAIQKQLKIKFFEEDNDPSIDVPIYLQKNSNTPVPIFFGLNFFGNQTITSDPSVKLLSGWLPNKRKFHIYRNRATEKSRGVRVER